MRADRCTGPARGVTLFVVALAASSCSWRKAEKVTASSSSVNNAPKIDEFLLYGERSVKLDAFDRSFGGDIGVRSPAATSFGPQLKVGAHDSLDRLHNLLSPSVSLGHDARVGDVQTDALTDDGAIRGTLAPFPAASMPPGPLAPLGTPGGSDVTVSRHRETTLHPGSYRDLRDDGTVFLEPGTYSFDSVRLGDHAKLLAKDGGATKLLVAGEFVTGEHATILPLSGGADKLAIYVAGNDPDPAHPIVSIGGHNNVTALIAAPHGTLSIDDHTDVTGAFAGFDVVVGSHVKLVFERGFPRPPANPPQQLTGYVTAAIAAAPLLRALPQSTVVDLAIGLPVQDLSGLAARARQVSDPQGSSYRQYLTPAQFTSMYSPSSANYQGLATWAQGAGLTVTKTFDNRLLLDVRGTAAQIGQALSANLVVRARPDGSEFFSIDREPAVTLAASNPIFRISGLDNRVPSVPGARPGSSTPGVGTGPGGLYVSADFRAAYASCTTRTGTGEQVGLFELDGFLTSDINPYACNSGLVTCNGAGMVIAGTVVPVNTVLVDGYNGAVNSTAGQAEATIDIQMAMAMAPGLSGIVVYEALNDGSAARHNDILNLMAGNTAIRQFSSSWFFGVDSNTQTILYTLAVQGQSFFQCSGDQGSSSWTTDPGDIRDLDAVTVVGGTILNMNNVPLSYQSETTWNRNNEGASGGGVAANTSGPFYQAPFANALGQMGKRVLPDVSMVATDEFGFFNGNNSSFLGTSLAAPLWAAWIALANEESASRGIAPAGFVNNFLYDVGLAAPLIYNGSFNDIQDSSTNAGSCTTGVGSGVCNGTWSVSTTSTNFTAATGYDMAVGLGTPKCHLFEELGTSTITVPTVDGGVDAAVDAGADAPDAAVAPFMVTVATAGSQGVRFCSQGGGFTPGNTVRFKFLNLPGTSFVVNSVEGPLIIGSGGLFTELDPTFGGGASSQQGYIMNCSADDLTKSMTIQVAEVEDPSKVATASISNTWVCGAEPRQTSTTETPLPFPPMFGQTTCPLPPN